MAMKWLNRVIAAVMLLVWLPATSLCLIERAGWLANDDCCPSSTGGAPDKQPASNSTCCTLASGSYKADDQERVMPVVPLLALGPALVSDEPHEWASQPSPIATASSPPELLAGWQFSFRAALPPRAPSIVS